MSDITTIPTSELVGDLLASQNDIKVCEFALRHNIQSYGGEYSVQDRLEKNKHFVKVISAELERRKALLADLISEEITKTESA